MTDTTRDGEGESEVKDTIEIDDTEKKTQKSRIFSLGSSEWKHTSHRLKKRWHLIQDTL